MPEPLPPPPVDLLLLEDLIGSDRAALAGILIAFLRSARSSADAIARAVAQRDSTSIQAAAHRLKSPACYIGAVTLGDLCVALETTSDDWPRIDVLNVELEVSLRAVEDYIVTWLRDGNTPP